MFVIIVFIVIVCKNNLTVPIMLQYAYRYLTQVKFNRTEISI